MGLEENYSEYVETITPQSPLGMRMLKAFLTGGCICTIGQFVINYCKEAFSMDTQTASAWCSLILILLSVLLTGFSLYQKITSFGGAGALVPITGFANSVAAPAVEYKPEGQVFGIGCKIFTIAGPVLLYGTLTSWLLGILYYLFQ